MHPVFRGDGGPNTSDTVELSLLLRVTQQAEEFKFTLRVSKLLCRCSKFML